MILKKDMSGEEVSAVIALLQRAGYWYGTIPTGRFDDVMENNVTYFQQTHVDESGRFLKPDGIVGPKTMWGLTHPFNADQKNYIETQIPDGIGKERTAILHHAWLDHMNNIREEPMGSNWGMMIARYGGQPGWAWCCLSLNYWIRKGLGHWLLEKNFPSIHKFFDAAKEAGLVVPIEKAIPGDAYIMLRPNGLGHGGLIARMPGKNRRDFNTLSGNEANKVKAGVRGFTDMFMAGAIRTAESVPKKFERGVVYGPRIGRVDIQKRGNT